MRGLGLRFRTEGFPFSFAYKTSQAIDRIVVLCHKISVFLVMIFILLGTWNVAGRFVGKFLAVKLTSSYFVDFQEYLFDIIFLSGIAYGLQVDFHSRVEFFFEKFSEKQRWLVEFLSLTLLLVPFATLVLIHTWSAFLAALAVREGSLAGGLPRYPIRLIVVAGIMLLILQALAKISQLAIKFLRNPVG